MKLNNAFDVKVSSSVFYYYAVVITYKPLPVCSTELPHYSLIVTNVTSLTYSHLSLYIFHGASYNLSAIFDHYYITHSQFILQFGNSLFSCYIKNSSFRSGLYDFHIFRITFNAKLNPKKCKFPGYQLVSTFVIEDSQFCDNWHGIRISGVPYLPRTNSNHFVIIIKSCLISNNTIAGLFIDEKFLTSVQINIIDTEFIGNKANVIKNSFFISLKNVTVANSTSTGLKLITSIVTIENKLIFRSNTGVVGGGLSITDSSQLIVSSSTNLEFIDNHASYKGGGIYVEELTKSFIILEAPNIPLTLINNSAAFGDDIYGYNNHRSNRFNLTNPNISST
uniref:Right handed beta helix domain-containing protein n=1 Tax=Amphimedon queenslandica TaxID=400682 RepID=A0A1X7VHK8_AMPQE